MNPAVDDLHIFVGQVDFPRPHAPLIVPEFGHSSTPIDRLAGRALKEENRGVEQVGDLLHEMESGLLVLIGRCPKYS